MFSSLRGRILILTSTIALLATMLFIYIVFDRDREQLLMEYNEYTTASVDVQETYLNGFVDNLTRDTLVLAQSPMLASFVNTNQLNGLYS